MRPLKNIKFFLNYVLGPVLFLWLSWSIYQQVKAQPDLARSWEIIRGKLSGSEIWKPLTVFMLMLVNWALETRKWQIVVARVQPISFLQGFKAILSGVSFSVTTPNRTGEYLGRVLYMDEGNRLRTISLTILCSLSQLLVTLVAGILALLILWKDITLSDTLSSWTPIWLKTILFGTGITLAFLTLFYFRVSLFARWIDKLPKSEKYAFLVSELEGMNATILLRLLSLSVVRFCVFIVQYHLLFDFFGVETSLYQTLIGTSLTFLILTLIPGFALADLGIRGEVNLKVMGLFSQNLIGISLTVALIWFINLILPALVGSLLILGIKMFGKKSQKTEEK